MEEYEVEMVKTFYRYVTVQAQDKSTALTLARDMVSEPSEDCGEGFLSYGNPYDAEVTQGPTNEKGFII